MGKCLLSTVQLFLKSHSKSENKYKLDEINQQSTNQSIQLLYDVGNDGTSPIPTPLM